MQVIESKNIALGIPAADWEDAMRKSGALLVDSGYITDHYIEMTVDCVRENGPYIVIAPGLALSHSRPDPSVLKTGLSLMTLAEPVCFDCENDPVDIVITLAAEDDSAHLDKIMIIGEFFSEEENMQKVIRSADCKAVAQMINGVSLS